MSVNLFSRFFLLFLAYAGEKVRDFREMTLFFVYRSSWSSAAILFPVGKVVEFFSCDFLFLLAEGCDGAL
jgi:hypothetical protein